MDPSSPFRICIIGCGGIATSHHGPAYARYASINPEVELSACCDIDSSKADAYAQRFGFRKSYIDYLQLLEVENPNAVCLNVPPERTTEIACHILRSGFPLLLEKPPGLTTADNDAMILAANLGNAPHQVAFNRRYTPLVRVLKEVLARDRFQREQGEIQHIQYLFFRVGRTDPDFTTTAIHGIDTVRHIAGSDYANITISYQDQIYLDKPVTNFFLDCRMTSGATAHLSFIPASGAVLERAAVHFQDNLFLLHLPVWNGLDSPGSLQWIKRGKIQQSWQGPEVSASSYDYALNGFWDEDKSFFDDIRHARRPICDLISTRQSVAVAQALRQRRSVFPDT